jgi:hypothetical protein
VRKKERHVKLFNINLTREINSVLKNNESRRLAMLYEVKNTLNFSSLWFSKKLSGNITAISAMIYDLLIVSFCFCCVVFNTRNVGILCIYFEFFKVY